MQKISYFHVFLEKNHVLFSIQRKNIIFSGKKNTIFPDNTRKHILQCNLFGKSNLSEHLEKENIVFDAVVRYLVPSYYLIY